MQKNKKLINWRSNLEMREMLEIEFCTIYKEKFDHGTQGHNLRVLVAKMALLLDESSSVIKNYENSFIEKK